MFGKKNRCGGLEGQILICISIDYLYFCILVKKRLVEGLEGRILAPLLDKQAAQ